jgi:catechol 2,3-dioxygenase
MNFHQPPSAYVSQLTLKVSNLQQSLHFYEQILGLKVIEQQGNQAKLGVHPNGNVLLSLLQPDEVTPLQPRTTGLYHFAILLPTRAALAQITHHLAKSGLQLGASDHLVSEALYLSDPDGNGIEIYRDRPSEDWNWDRNQVKMSVDPLDFDDLLNSAPDEPWSGMPEGTIIGHIHLHVADIAQSERFYCEGLHFDVTCRYGTQAMFLSTSDYHHHIAANTWQGVGAPRPSASSAGLAHFTIVYPDEQTRESVLVDLKKLDADVIEIEDGYQTIDPAGNVIQIAVHREGR